MNSCRAPSHNRAINSSESPEIRKVENNYLTGGILFSLARCLLMGDTVCQPEYWLGHLICYGANGLMFLSEYY